MHRQYHWLEIKKRESTKKFFMTILEIEEITPVLYTKYECLLFILIHGYYKKKDEPNWFEFDPFTDLFKPIFGQNPTIQNLMLFFNHPMIKVLWTKNFQKSR